jgi:beta-1,2-mannosidase
MLARQITLLDRLSNTLTPPILLQGDYCKLFVAPKNPNPFAINKIQTLPAKCPGYGVPLRSSARSASLYAEPRREHYLFSSSGSGLVRSRHRAHHRFFTLLFSTSSESLFSQFLCFHIYLRCPLVFLFFTFLLLLTSGSQAQNVPFGAWTRASELPLISPQGTGWESVGTFNPAVILLPAMREYRRSVTKDGVTSPSTHESYPAKFVMLYRAQDAAGTSRLGYAESIDGIHFTRLPQPILSPETDYEKDGGMEDPRLQIFGDTYYLTYTGYNKKDAQLCLATSRDLIHWDRKGVILPAYKGNWNKGWTKSGAIVPEKIDGKYWMYWLGTSADKTDQMGISYSIDLLHWTEATETPVLPRRPGKFDSRVVEPGPPPILTDTGIVLIYNGADDKLVYRTGVAVFDRKDPRKLLSRTDQPIFSPEKEWEKVGQVPNVVFVEGMARHGNRWFFYYGGADKYVGVAEALVQ